jgi:hypothetical protein
MGAIDGDLALGLRGLAFLTVLEILVLHLLLLGVVLGGASRMAASMVESVSKLHLFGVVGLIALVVIV